MFYLENIATVLLQKWSAPGHEMLYPIQIIAEKVPIRFVTLQCSYALNHLKGILAMLVLKVSVELKFRQDSHGLGVPK